MFLRNGNRYVNLYCKRGDEYETYVTVYQRRAENYSLQYHKAKHLNVFLIM